jgi:DNA-directed RNA polymerase sigma subunit (sigma70/sigma32)
LGKIANNLAIDRTRKEDAHKPIQLDHEEWQDIRERSAGTASKHTSEVCLVMSEELDEREQDVIRTTFTSYDPGRANQKLSSEVLQALAARWETTPGNIRQIRKRALAKLRKALPASMSGASSERAGP